MPYCHLDDLSISDIAFFAWGKTVEEVFLASAEALLSFTLQNPGQLREVQSIDFQFEEVSLEMLLFNYLEELIFYKDAKQLLLKAKKIKIEKREKIFLLEGKLKGEKIDPKRHFLDADIKAVTLYKFKLMKKSNKWQATVVLDV